MGRPAKNRIRTTVAIEQETFDRLEIFLMDPKKGGIAYGSLSALTNKLYEKFLEHLEKPDVDAIAVLRNYGIDIASEETIDD